MEDNLSFDEAAKQAEEDLENLEAEAVKAVADWFAKWYASAGHKRLGRILVSVSKQ